MVTDKDLASHRATDNIIFKHQNHQIIPNHKYKNAIR
jgi:hypothetical protein